MSTLTKPIQVIDVDNESGKEFIKKLEILKKELKINSVGEKVKQIRDLTEEQILNNPFLYEILTFKNFEVKKIFIGNFGRKVGYKHLSNPVNSEQSYFRFFIHLGDPEVYYLTDNTVKDKPIALLNGQGLIISSLSVNDTNLIVYSDPIRIIYDSEVQSQIPKIRPRNYSRTTIVYDVLYDLESALEEINEEESVVEEPVVEELTGSSFQ